MIKDMWVGRVSALKSLATFIRLAKKGRVLPHSFLVFLFSFSMIGMAGAHDPDHHELDQWYAGLMQPDVPKFSCCGEADSYWCDDIHIREGQTYCKITDDRPDAPLHRPHVEIGTEIQIPNHKLKWDKGNPTGHAIVFMSPLQYVFCFVQAGGV